MIYFYECAKLKIIAKIMEKKNRKNKKQKINYNEFLQDKMLYFIIGFEKVNDVIENSRQDYCLCYETSSLTFCVSPFNYMIFTIPLRSCLSHNSSNYSSSNLFFFNLSHTKNIIYVFFF